MAVSLASPTLGTALFPASFHGLRKPYRSHASLRHTPPHFSCCCSLRPSPPSDDEDQTSSTDSVPVQILECPSNRLIKAVFATAVTGLVLFSPCGDVLAAKSGGRVGGQAFRSAAPAPPPRAAPRMEGSRRTNIFINPPSFVAPPLYGGYGSPYFGGWGWSPFSFFGPGPGVVVGVGSGFNIFGFLLLMAFVGSIINFFRRGRDDDYYD